MKKVYLYITILLLFLAHLPFLNADPDALVDPTTRSPWTDEGLYSSQIRSYVDHGVFDMEENSALVLSPLFSFIQLPFYLVFGTKLIVLRMIVLLATVITL